MSRMVGRTYRLYPNKTQEASLSRQLGMLRFVWNKMLDEIVRTKDETGKFPSKFTLTTICRKIRDNPEHEWLRELSSRSIEGLAFSMHESLKRFRDVQKGGRKLRRKIRPDGSFLHNLVGFPRFKARGRSNISIFFLASSRNANGGPGCEYRWEVSINGDRIRLPKLGHMRFSGDFGIEGRMLSCRVFRSIGKWYLSAVYECEDLPETIAQAESIGVDVGIKTLATTFDGQEARYFENPRALYMAEGRLKKAQRILSRREGGDRRKYKTDSRRYLKAKLRVEKIHKKVAEIRKNTQFRVANDIVCAANTIKLESLNVSGMMKNSNLARACSDAAMGQLLGIIKYKAAWHGRSIVEAGMWYPSTKTCSSCGKIAEEMPLYKRIFTCECGLIVDRDENAARNLYKYQPNDVVDVEIKEVKCKNIKASKNDKMKHGDIISVVPETMDKVMGIETQKNECSLKWENAGPPSTRGPGASSPERSRIPGS